MKFIRMIRQLASYRFIGLDSSQALVSLAPAVPLREIFRRFWPAARPYRWWFGVVLIFVTASALIDTASIWMYKLLVDDVLVPRDFRAFFTLVAPAYVGLAFLGWIISFIRTYLSGWISQNFVLSLRTDFFRHLTGLSLGFFEGRRLGDVLSRLSSDIRSIENLLLSGVTTAISDILRIVFFAGALLYLNWQLGLVSFLVLPFFWLAARYFSRKIRDVSREQRRRSGSVTAVAEESLSNIALVQAQNREEYEWDRFQRQASANFAARMVSTRLRALFSPVVGFIDLAGNMVILSLGIWALSQDQLTMGGLLAFIAYLSRLYSPIRGLSGLINTVNSASASAERIIEFQDQTPSVTERPDAVRLSRARGFIELDSVSFSYPDSPREALSQVSFSVGPGETLALVGPSGAGKSTVAKLLLRFYDPSAGRILLDGHDLRDVDLKSLRDNVAIVLQETLVFDGTIRENIAYGRLEATEEDIIRAAQAADAHDFIVSLPEGYDTLVGQKGRRLSGGQRQRIGIARAMVRDAPILILDEPTTGLDTESAQRVLEPLRRLISGRTTIIISHNFLTVSEASSIVVVEGGRITERGTHAQLSQRDGTYQRLYRLHALKPEGEPSEVSAATGD